MVLPRSLRSVPTGSAFGAALMVAVLLLATLAGPVGAASADPEQRRQWGLATIGAPQAWSTGRGDGIVIAIVDTGVDPAHEDLAAKIVAGRDIVDNDNDPRDEYGHGTHVAGIAAAISGNGRGVAGVAPGAAIMPVRVLDENGEGSADDVLAGVRWAVDHGADVVNLSLGVTGQQVFGTGLEEAVRYAWARGVITVVAAGNDYVLSSGFADEPAVVVSATTRNDQKPDYSGGVGAAQWGMAAPGGGCTLAINCPLEDDIFSTYWQSGNANAYAYSAGTSMAAPHVAGAAAILRGLGLNPKQTVDRLLATAVDLGAAGRDNTYGAGRLDLAAAVSGLGTGATTVPRTLPPPADSPASAQVTNTADNPPLVSRPRPSAHPLNPATSTSIDPRSDVVAEHVGDASVSELLPSRQDTSQPPREDGGPHGVIVVGALVLLTALGLLAPRRPTTAHTRSRTR